MMENRDRKEKGDLEKLKKNYETLRMKYELPEYSKLVEDFYIERASDVETDYPIREIRRFMADKFFNYLRSVEALLNPVNVPMYVFSMVKNLSIEDKKRLSDVYKELAKFEIKIMELDLSFSEQKEADFIKESFKLWQKIKKELLEITDKINKNWDNKSEEGRRDYFG